MVVRLKWTPLSRVRKITEWLEEHVGRRYPECEGYLYGIRGPGWALNAEAEEDPHAMVLLPSGYLEVEIDDERLMTAFLLRWG